MRVYRNELYHYGVLGMRWGVRKRSYSKNPGSRSNNSSKRFKKTIKDRRRKQREVERRNRSGTYKTKARDEFIKKDLDKMSNKEIQDAINRMNLEKQYRNLTKTDYNKGYRIAQDVLKYVGVATTVYGLYNKYGPIMSDYYNSLKYPPKG